MRIINVKYLIDYKLEIEFYSTEKIIFDFKPVLKKSQNQSIKKYLDIEKFKQVTIDTGFLSWNNGEMELSGEWIYEEHKNNLEKKTNKKKSLINIYN